MSSELESQQSRDLAVPSNCFARRLLLFFLSKYFGRSNLTIGSLVLNQDLALDCVYRPRLLPPPQHRAGERPGLVRGARRRRRLPHHHVRLRQPHAGPCITR